MCLLGMGGVPRRGPGSASPARSVLLQDTNTDAGVFQKWAGLGEMLEDFAVMRREETGSAILLRALGLPLVVYSSQKALLCNISLAASNLETVGNTGC